MNATEIAAALSTRAEDVCRRYLPRGRKQGRYWTSRRHKRRQGALALRASGASRHTRKMDRRRDQRAWRSARSHPSAHRRSIAAARHGGGPRLPLHCRRPLPPMAAITPAAMTVRKRRAALWRRCRPIDGTHAEAYLHARAIGLCRFPALRFHPDLIHRGDDGIHRLPALVAAVTGDDGAIEGVQRTWLDPKRTRQGQPRDARVKHSGASTAGPFASAGSPPVRPCLPAKASKPCYPWSPPSPVFMPPRLFRRAVSAPSNHPKISPCWSSPAIKTWRAGTPPTVFSAAVWNAAFPQS